MATLLVVASLSLTGCGKKSESSAPGTSAKGQSSTEAGEVKPIDRKMLGAFGKLPAHFDSKTNPPTPAKLDLGHMLYFDARLSRSGTISCNSCHGLSTFGVDGKATSVGHAGDKGDRNAPTVFNAAGQFRQFWDGRMADVEAQAKGPVLNPIEHGLKDAAEVEQLLAAIPGYVVQFQRAFPGENSITFDNFAKAVGAFERKLVTPAPWDRFLGGDDGALSDEQKKGARLFVETGCISCHNGPLLGGQTYQKLGKVKPWPRPADEGRKKETNKAADLHHFKVPTLRNIAKTGPYFHDGQTTDLGEAVRLMARHQLGRELTASQTSLLVSFLGSLTGEPPQQWTAKPTLPPNPVTPPPAAATRVDAGSPAADKAGAAKLGDAGGVVPTVPPAPAGPGSAPEPKPPANDKVPATKPSSP